MTRSTIEITSLEAGSPLANQRRPAWELIDEGPEDYDPWAWSLDRPRVRVASGFYGFHGRCLFFATEPAPLPAPGHPVVRWHGHEDIATPCRTYLDEVEALVAAARTSGLARLRWKILVPIY